MKLNNSNSNEEIKKFALEVKIKLCDKCKGKDNFYIHSIPDLVMQMIEHKNHEEVEKFITEFEEKV